MAESLQARSIRVRRTATAGARFRLPHAPVRLVSDKGQAVDIPATTDLDGIVEVGGCIGRTTGWHGRGIYLWTSVGDRSPPEDQRRDEDRHSDRLADVSRWRSSTVGPEAATQWSGGSIGAKAMSCAKEYRDQRPRPDLDGRALLNSSHGARVPSSAAAPTSSTSKSAASSRSSRLRDDCYVHPRSRLATWRRSSPATRVQRRLRDRRSRQPRRSIPTRKASRGDVSVSMRRTATDATSDLGLWVVIRKSTEALSFNNYFRLRRTMCCAASRAARRRLRNGALRQDQSLQPLRNASCRSRTPRPIASLKVATEAFVVVNCGVALTQLQVRQRTRP